jgi:glutamate-1-semialdehyde 2,1-aminomutase
MVVPSIAFDRGEGAYIWDTNGKKYVDFHAAFAPHLLGHNAAAVNAAVIESINAKKSLFGSGPTAAEGELAELSIPGAKRHP